MLNVGHSHPEVIQAVQEQAARFLHTDFTVIPYEGYVELAERLLAVSPFRGPAKAAFFNAGTEAVENAVKFARAYTGRTAVVCFEGGFHGRTLLSLTMTSKTHPYKAGLGPFAPEVYRLPFPDSYRGPSPHEALEALERSWSTVVPPEHIACVVIEPQLGEGGFMPASQEYMDGLRSFCDRHGIVLVADEVQTGFGRTGKMWAVEHYGIEPDLMTVAKSIAAGLPLSGVLGKAEIMDAPAEGGVGGTYVGNPVALAAALAVLDVFEDEGLVERAAEIGETMRARMLGWQERFERDRRRARPRRDARAGARPGPGLQGAGAGARGGSDRRGSRARPPSAQSGRLRQLHPRALPAHDHGSRARRGTRRLGAVARGRLRSLERARYSRPVVLGRDAKTKEIARVPLFARCSKRELAMIAGDRRRDRPPGRQGAHQGRRAGPRVLRAARRQGRGDAEAAAGATFSRRGDFLGEIALVSRSPRTATVTAETPVRVLVIRDVEFRSLLERVPSIQSKVLEALADRLAADAL